MTKTRISYFPQTLYCAVFFFPQILIAVNIFLSYIQYRLTYMVIGVFVVLFLEPMLIGEGT